MRRILITGGAGYVGSAVAWELLGGYQVVVLDECLRGDPHSIAAAAQGAFCQPQVVKGTVCDIDLVRSLAYGCHAIIHLAAIVGDTACSARPERARTVNVTGTQVVCEVAESLQIPVIFASTCSVYAEKPNVYIETKQEAESAVLDVGGAVLRLATVYGLGFNMRWDTMINQMIRDAADTGGITIWGAGNWRPYVHIDTVAQFVRMLLEKPQRGGGMFDIVDFNITKAALACRVSQFTYCKLHIDSKRKDPRDYRLDGMFGGIEIERDHWLSQLDMEIQRLSQMIGMGAWARDQLYGEQAYTAYAYKGGS